jgi:hypothetical protein
MKKLIQSFERISKTAIRRFAGNVNPGFETEFGSLVMLPKQIICGG